MRSKYSKRIGGLVLAALMISGIAFASSSTVQAQRRQRVVIVRPVHRPFYRPFGFGYRRWREDPYHPWSRYGSYYRQYVFDNGDKAASQGYNDGFKTGKEDGKKAKSFDPQRSHYYHDSGFGNFAEVYRSGFSRGYQEGYRVGGSDRAG